MSAPVLSLRGVQHRFGARVALDVPQLDLGIGLTAVLGRNGSGKSTLARLLATVWAPTEGVVLLDDQNVADGATRLRLRRMLGYTAQHDALPGRMRVGAYCDYVGVLKEIETARQRARWTHWALHQVGLVDRIGDRISSLSGGMQRRLAVAQALLGHPRVLILDEPTASLDPERRSAVAAMLSARPDTTTVVMTHHPDDIGAVADRVLVLDEGRVCFSGSPAQLSARAGDASMAAGFAAVLASPSRVS